jgi:predicted nucleic acid-binding protein
VAVDTGPLVALFNAGDRHHVAATKFLRPKAGDLVTNFPVISEVLFLLDFSVEAQTEFLEWVVAGGLEVDQETMADAPRIIEIMRKYADLPADFADASLVALCERRRITSVATIDKHFDIYRTLERKRLQNVFLTK